MSKQTIDLREKEVMLVELESDRNFKTLEAHYLAGGNTRARLENDHQLMLSEEQFSAFEHQLKKKNFAIGFFSEYIPFSEVLNYYRHLNEETGYITMQKQKDPELKM